VIFITFSAKDEKYYLTRSIPKNVCLVAVDSAHCIVVGDLEMKMIFWCLLRVTSSPWPHKIPTIVDGKSTRKKVNPG